VLIATDNTPKKKNQQVKTTLLEQQPAELVIIKINQYKGIKL
jgi:hypothetical protein